MVGSHLHQETATARWIIVLGSAAIAWHLTTIMAAVLAAPSGPWPSPRGVGMLEPPPFAQVLDRIATPTYLRVLKMTHNYRFISNRPAEPGVLLEFHLKDGHGGELAIITLPDKSSNRWLRQRQKMLMRPLADDQLVQPLPGEAIAPAGRAVRTVTIWAVEPDRTLRIRQVPEHLIPRDRPVFAPSETALILARSYGRYLYRERGATSIELVRRTREPWPPSLAPAQEPPPGTTQDLVASFGELPR